MDEFLVLIVVLLFLVVALIYLIADCLYGYFEKGTKYVRLCEIISIKDPQKTTSEKCTMEPSWNQELKIHEIEQLHPDPVEKTEVQVESGKASEEEPFIADKPHPIADFVSLIYKGRKTTHDQEICNTGGGAWGTSMSISGRTACTGNWTTVAGGPFDKCQCQNNGGFH